MGTGRTFGIIAGGGPLPRELAMAARASGREVFILALEGATDPGTVADLPHAWVPIGQLARSLRALREAEVGEVCMIGPVRRPTLASLRLDLRAMSLLPRYLKNAGGDDGLLRLLVGELEREGFRVVGAHEIAGDLTAPVGVLTRARPDAQAELDIARGVTVARRLGEVDVGQAVVVQQGLVLGVEAIEGTDALLERVGALRREGPGGVLVKLCKPGQERRTDLPTVGPATVAGAQRAGLRGIAVEAGATLLVERARSVEEADRGGLFLVGIEPDPA